MIKHVGKYFLFSLGLLFIATLLFQISAKVEAVYPILSKRYQQLFDQQNELEVITIGSSHSVAIDFPSLGLDGYHLWDFGEDLFESVYKTKVILSQLPKLKTVFLTLPYPIFVHDNAHSALGARYRNRAKLHYISGDFQLINQDVNAFVKGKLAPLSRYDHWVFLPKHLAQNTATITPVKETLSIDTLGIDGNMRGFTQGFETIEDLNDVALEKLTEHLKLVTTTQQKVWNIEEKTKAALAIIIAELQQRNIRLVLYTSPFCRSYLEAFPISMHNAFQQVLSDLAKQYQVEYYDYSRHPDFMDNPTYFQDGNHLSSAGAKAFSELLRKELAL